MSDIPMGEATPESTPRRRGRGGKANWPMIMAGSALAVSLVGSGVVIVNTLNSQKLLSLADCADLIAAAVGTDGDSGSTGEPGPAGSPGPTGEPGADGSDGADGTDGTDGQPGPSGPTGPTGPAGPSGAPGADGSCIGNASLPLLYDSNTQTISLDLDGFPYLGTLESLQFDLSSGAQDAPGRLVWNADKETLNLQTADGEVTLQIGQEQIQKVYNGTGSTLLNGRAVRLVGGAGSNIAVDYIDTSVASESESVLGILTQDIAPGGTGFVTTAGLVNELDTSLWAPGSELFVTTDGQLSTSRPLNGNIIQIGYSVVQDAAIGSLFVNVAQTFQPIIGSQCVVPGAAGGPGTYTWYNLAGQRWLVVCDY